MASANDVDLGHVLERQAEERAEDSREDHDEGREEDAWVLLERRQEGPVVVMEPESSAV